MAKGQTTVSDFAVAPRRSRPKDQATAEDTGSSAASAVATEGTRENQPRGLVSNSVEADLPASRLIAPTAEARRERAVSKALQREDSRVRLRDLKRARDRESKHYVNCPLDYETKKRLEKAALENDVKMTVIMKAAIDQFLKDNGY
ncbi:hypothetical protein ACDY96_30780 [Rhizobium mongolense]|uniref:hypothetical protein n=1 Tax=Rhizobium mongolense TaxID=57676 RepID=UPI003557DB5A